MKKILAISLFLLSFIVMSARMSTEIDSFSFKRTGGGQINITVQMMEVGFMLEVTSCSFKEITSKPVLIEDEQMVADLTAMFNEEAEYMNMPIEGGLTGTWTQLSYLSYGEEVLLGDPVIIIDAMISTIFEDVEAIGQSICNQ